MGSFNDWWCLLRGAAEACRQRRAENGTRASPGTALGVCSGHLCWGLPRTPHQRLSEERALSGLSHAAPGSHSIKLQHLWWVSHGGSCFILHCRSSWESPGLSWRWVLHRHNR